MNQLIIALLLLGTTATEPQATLDDAEAQRLITRVQDSFLAFNDRAELGLVLRVYPWFTEKTWRAERVDGRTRVVFEGLIDDEKAVADFYKRNKYAWPESFKAMQLKSAYQLSEDKEKLAFRLFFAFSDARSFVPSGGELGVQRASDQSWAYQPMSDKTFSAVLEGVYKRVDPYLILVNGLPYK